MARITGKFGEHRSYYKPGRFHEGVDLAFAENEPIKAYGGGKVTFVGFDPNGYGNYMKILADDGTTHLYGHANRFNKKLGDIVRLGDELGLVGSTGRSTGPHIHFGVYKQGKAVNPMDVINQKPQLKQSLGQVNITQTPELQEVISAYAQQEAENKAKNLALREQKLATQENLLNMVNDVLNSKNQTTTLNFSPDIARGLNSIFGTKIYNPATKRIEDMAGGYVNQLENQILINKKAESDRYSSKLDLLKDMMKELGMDEREANKLQATIDKNNQDYEIDKEKNNIESLYKQGLISNQQKELLIKEAKQKEDARHNKVSEKLEGKKINETVRHNQASEQNQENKIVTGKDGKNGQVKMSAADAKALSENNQTLAALDAGIKEISKNPNAYTWVKGKLGSDITNRIDPKGVKTRSQIDNVTAVYRKWLTGAQMSDKERKDYERFLPAPTDNGKIVKQKLQAMKESIETKNKALMSQYQQNTNNPLGLNL